MRCKQYVTRETQLFRAGGFARVLCAARVSLQTRARFQWQEGIKTLAWAKAHEIQNYVGCKLDFCGPLR